MSNSSPFQSPPPYATPHGGPVQQPLEYSQHARGKPGILTAVGIISIVLGAFGALSSLGTIAQGVMFGIVTPRMTTVPAPAPPPPPPPPVMAPTPLPPVTAPPARVVSPQSAPSPAGTPAPVAVEAGPADADAGADAVASPAGAPATSASPTPPPGAATTATSTVVVTPFSFNFDRRTVAMMFVEGGIGLALAVFLLVLGILTLRGSPRGRRGHVLWAWMKLPAAALTGISTAMVAQAMFQNMTVAGPSGAVSANLGGPMVVIQAVITAAFACIYPVAILIVMRTKGVRAYYDAGAGAALQ